jgi:hypothetical protein
MPRSAPIGEAFNSGELSPRMAGRVGSAPYAAGCHRLEGFIPDIAGPAVKCGGTAYVAAVKDEARRSWLVRFERDRDSVFMLEFGHLYVRFYKDYATVLSGGSPYEVATPYTEADLINAAGAFAIDYTQSGDILYLAHRSHQPRKLSHFTDTNWTLTEYSPIGGPFQDQNATAVTVYASANTGAVTLNASAATFTADMVGTLFYLEQKAVSDVLQWEVGKVITTPATRRSGGRNYSALNSATTGTITLTHTEGAVYDGDAGVQWQYLDAGYGWAQITGFTSSTQVSATVLSRIPDGAVGSGNASTKWALGAWSDSQGWPDCVGFYLDRLVWARDQLVWMSVAGDYENMQPRDAGRQLTDSAISLPIPSRRGNPILWLETLEVGLVVGTGSDEWLVGPASRNDPLGPLNISANPAGAIGSRAVPALRIFDSIIFTQRSGKRLRALRYLQGEGAIYADLNAYADHVTPGFISTAYVAEPYSMIVGAGSDGSFAAVTYYPEQQVLGWWRRPMAGVVECVQAIPSPDASRDDLWLIVRRTIGGVTRRYVEWMKPPLADDADQKDAFYVDSGITYSGAAATVISGLGHLEGQTLNVLVNGATHPQRTVASGSITLQRAGTTVHAGLPYTARLATMDIEAGSATGTAQGKMKRAYRLAVRLLRTLGGRLGTSETKLDTLQFRDASVPMGSAPPLFTGDKYAPGPGGSDRVARVWFEHSDPLPATVVAVMPQIQTEDA